MERLLAAGNYPGLATHDEAIIAPRARVRPARADRHRPVRVPDALRRPPRPPGAGSARRATACGSTSPSGPSGILTSCGGWRSDPPTSPSSSATCVRGVGTGTVSELTLGGYMAEARARGRLRRQRRPGVLGRHLRRGRARPARTLRRGAAVRALVARRRPAGRPRGDRDRWPGAARPKRPTERLERAVAVRREGRAGRGDRPRAGGVVTALLGTVLERDGSVYRVATATGEVRAVLARQGEARHRRRWWWATGAARARSRRRAARDRRRRAPHGRCSSAGCPRAAASVRSPPTWIRSSSSPRPARSRSHPPAHRPPAGRGRGQRDPGRGRASTRWTSTPAPRSSSGAAGRDTWCTHQREDRRGDASR